MPLKQSWVDHLFAKLSVRYGAAFLRQWPDADPALVKADWAEVLDGLSRESLAYALRYLPNAPPNAMQFRDLCRRASAPDVQRLPAPTEPRERGTEVIALIYSGLVGGSRDGLSPAELCIRNIEHIATVRGCTTRVQREMLESCRRVVPRLQSKASA